MKRVNEIVQRAIDQLNALDLPAAEATCREIFALEPNNVNALRIMGAIAREQNDYRRALDYCQQAVALADRVAQLQFELGVTLFGLNRSREAYEAYLKAIELDPTMYVASLNISAIMEQQERFAEARQWAQKTLQLKPDYALAHYNLANACREMGSIDEAIKSYELAHKYRPDHKKTLWNLGICHLLLGNFREGWPMFECRQEAEEVMLDKYKEPRWNGEPLDGRTIVVHAEQGIGDEILFASCFPDIIARAKNGRCILVCDPRLERLFARSFPTAKVYSHLRRTDWSPPALPERIDCQIPAGSLPSLFRTSREAFPRRKRFLVVEPSLEAMWRDRLAALGGELNVGISWRAGGKPTERRKRSIPLDAWADVLTTPGVRFVNLQYGDALADLATARERFGIEIHDWEDGDPLVDVDSYVAKISALDLVISVGNATVHMAGAVGTPAWTMLPTLPSWRWMAAGEQSRWYSCVRLFRQQERGKWASVIKRIAMLLRGAAAAEGEGSTIGLLAEEFGRGVERRPKPQARFAAANEGDVAADDRQDADGVIDSDQLWLGGAELVGHEIIEVVDRLITEGRVAEQMGDLAQAEKCYRDVLQLAPRHVKALCGLGIVARKSHRTDLAIRCFRRALSVAEPTADYHLHLADALLDAGRIDEALSGYQHAIDLDPSHTAAQMQVARVLRQAGRHEEASEQLRNVVAFDPQNHDAFVELGRCLAASCQIDQSIDCFRQALRLKHDSTTALEGMGCAYLEDHCYPDAEECFRKAIASSPGRAEAYFHLARTMEAQGRLDAAADALEQSTALDPRADKPLLRLALVRRAQGDLIAAEQTLQRAADLKPSDANLLTSLGVVQREQGQTAGAIRSFDRALAITPDHADAHLNRGMALLESERLAAGWSEYEWRGQSGRSLPSDPFPLPRWNGASLTGQTILVYAEQSPAEEVLFASCYEDVIARAADCVIICDPRMERLFKRSFPAAQVYPVVRGGEAQWRLPMDARCTAQIPAGSLPLFLRSSAASFPRVHHFLTADASRVAFWRARYATTGEGLKVGLAWSGAMGGGQKSPSPPARSAELAASPLPQGERGEFETWRQLVEWSCGTAHRVQWINLQDGPNFRAQRAALESQLDIAIHDWPAAHAHYDFDDLAARIAALDLVISVGGLPAHVAGALGVPAWVVVRPQNRWRWLARGETTPWYSSIRLFQPTGLGVAPVQPEIAAGFPGPAKTENPIECLREELLKRLETPAEEQRMRSASGPHWRPQTDRRNTKTIRGE